MSDFDFDGSYEARLELHLRQQDQRIATITARRKLAARIIADDFDGTEVLPSYTEARA